jgi:hypothetical protein
MRTDSTVAAPGAHEWVSGWSEDAPFGATKMLTLDLPTDLYNRIKRKCFAEGLRMQDVVNDALKREFNN